MKINVRITNTFKKAAKPLIKKYPSLIDDLSSLQEELLANPRLGTPLGDNCYKLRLSISSKGKGKSGGARVISHVETIIIIMQRPAGNEETYVDLITIYDKSDTATISQSELKALVKKALL